MTTMIDDTEYEWLPETDPKWSTNREGFAGMKCRYTVGPGRVQCRAPAVATLMRGRSPGRWAYCEHHLYGRRLVNGVIEYRYFKGSLAHIRAKALSTGATA